MIIGSVEIEHIKGYSNKFLITRGFIYKDKKITILIKSNWITDGASVPRLFWTIFPPIACKYLEAVILHDALYKSQKLNRKLSDLLFLKAMEDLKVNKIKRLIMYYSVRLFGKIAWDKNKRNGLIDTCVIMKYKK